MRTSHRLAAALAVTSLTLAACGGGSDGDADDVETADAPVEEAPVEEELADVEEEPAEEEPAEEEPADVEEAPAEEPADEPVDEEPADDGAAGEAVAASLVEWAIDAPTEYAAGTISFNATNNGSFPHEFVVIRGDGYESLPLTDSGGVIEEELPEGDLIARTPRIGGGSTEELTVDLEPGTYVLVCNLGGGSNSHAGQGQNLDIVVS